VPDLWGYAPFKVHNKEVRMTYNPPPPPPEVPGGAYSPGGPYQPPQPIAPGGTDRSTLFGWIGIVTGICCCGLLGIIFGWLSIQDAKKWGKSPTLGWVALIIGVVGVIWNIIGGSIYLARR
jgi:hypothetical protein